MHRLSGCLLLLLLLAHPGQVFAVASAVITPEGTGSYVIELMNCVKLREVQLTVDYPLGLGTPMVIPGSSAISNTVHVSNSTSMVRLDVIASKGSLPSGGYLVSLSFPATQQGDPVPLGLSGWATDIDGKSQYMKTWYQGPHDPPREPEADYIEEEQTSDSYKAAESAPSNPKASAVAATGGGDRLKTEVARAGNEKNTASQLADALHSQVKAQSAVIERVLPRDRDLQGKPLPPIKTFPSVLDRFQSFKGERTEAALCQLFDPDPAAPFHQTPAVAMADGRTAVTVTFNLAFPGQDVNIMVLTNTRLLSFNYVNDGTSAEMIVMPDEGSYRCSLMANTGDRIFDLPLTIAPPLAPELVVLGVNGEEIIRRDYNGDGVADYLDDYILMANRLVFLNKTHLSKIR
jgi:hypothetical protein